MKHQLTIIFTFILISGLAQSTIESIPNQKLINNSYVSNPDNILSAATVAQIDAILNSLEQQTSAQVAVVAVNSIGDSDIFEFAQQLFDKWGIGNASTDNGLLILLVQDQHTIRFHTGYGLEGTLPDAICKQIQRDYMVPEFRNDNYDGGVLAGVQQVQKVLTDPVYAAELKADEESTTGAGEIILMVLGFLLVFLALIIFIVKYVKKQFADSKDPEFTQYPEMRLNRWNWLAEFAGIPALILIGFLVSGLNANAILCMIILYLYYTATLVHRAYRAEKVVNRFSSQHNYYQITEFHRAQQTYWFFISLLFPIPFLLYFFHQLSRKKKYRNHPRHCKVCQGAMHKLDENADDQFLSKGKQMEEKLKSVDYDVWKCEACAATEAYHYKNRWTKYKECTYCKTYASFLAGRETVVSATYSSSGSGKETHTCKFCGKNNVTTYIIPQLTRSSSGSSSSSGGGSWGGGSSGGGGASSRW
jgi:uncharacterized protein